MALPILDNSLGSVPVPLTGFVGREREIAELTALIRDPHIRLITVTGPGGVGKTRLVIEAINGISDQFPEGVVYLSLAAVTDPELFLPSLAQTFGIQNLEQDGIGRLNRFLCDRRLLIVIDNFEQVIDAAAGIASLLAGCPDLKIIVTSRVRLRVSGEHQYPLAPMSRHHAHNGAGDGPLPDCVRLFVERARAVQPDFTETAENLADIDEICQRVDCLPLAIELAAARISVLPLASLLGRLEKALPLLTGGARDLPARQQTMRNAIAWSYDLLTDTEQRVVRRLAALPAGFSFDVLEPDVALTGESGIDFLDIVASLVDKSLLRREIGQAGDTRYVMLDTIREFATEQLQISGERDWMLQRYATQFVQLAINVQPHLSGQKGAQALWLRRIDDEFANFRSVLDLLETTGDAPRLLRLICALDWYFTTRSAHVNMRRWLEIAAQPDNGADALTRIDALNVIAYLASVRGYIDVARASVDTCKAIALETNDPYALGIAHFITGFVTEFWDDHRQAMPHYVAAIDDFRSVGANNWLQYVLSEAGNLLTLTGYPAEARPLIEEAIQIARDLGDNMGLGDFTAALASLERREGHRERATQLYREAFQLATDVGDLRTSLGIVSGLAGIAGDAGLAKQGVRWLGAVEALKERAGIARVNNQINAEMIAQQLRSKLGDDAYAAELSIGRTMDWQHVVAEALALSIDGTARSGADGDPKDQFGLTPRERDVLRELVAGCSDKEIADRLFIGARTVQTHVANLIAKLDVGNRTEAAAVAVRDNLLQTGGNYGERHP